MDSINPTTGQTTGTYEELDDTTLEARLEAAERTFEEWRRVAFDERATLMAAAARVLDQERRKLPGRSSRFAQPSGTV
jgi:succinate-semialdehyde dehydrogenase/glutarate-semialdehyde dehydrogenase